MVQLKMNNRKPWAEVEMAAVVQPALGIAPWGVGRTGKWVARHNVRSLRGACC
jgi:hypothetical protein